MAVISWATDKASVALEVFIGSLVVVDLIGDLRRRNYTLKRSHFFAVRYDSRMDTPSPCEYEGSRVGITAS